MSDKSIFATSFIYIDTIIIVMLSFFQDSLYFLLIQTFKERH